MLIADLASTDRRVAVAGSSHGRWWPPLEARRDLEVIDFGDHTIGLPRIIRRALRRATVVASKPVFSSFGAALLADVRPIVLDIDDPELALIAMDARTLLRSMARFDGPVLTALLSRLRDRADAVTVSSTVLQSFFGGTVIPHARDERYFAPSVARDRATARRAIGIDEAAHLIVFVGTIRPHKGVDILMDCVERVRPARIAIVGADANLDLPNGVITVPPVDYATAMAWVAASDIVAVPQRDGPIGRRQSPAKVIDALAVGRAIVASDVAPVREMVGEAGVLIRPGSSAVLGEALRNLLDDEERRHHLEELARARFLERFSYEAVRPAFSNILATAEMG
jgi:glycosyltransferase involved in cell wall biosynthesis